MFFLWFDFKETLLRDATVFKMHYDVLRKVVSTNVMYLFVNNTCLKMCRNWTYSLCTKASFYKN